VLRAVLTFCVAAGLLGCTRAEIVSADGSVGADAGIRDAASDAARLDAGLDAGTADASCAYTPVDTTGMPAGCVRRRPPGRPTCDVASVSPDFVFALRSMNLHTGVDVGLDLDGYCTTDVTGPASCDAATGAHPIDLNEGIDNGYAPVLSALEFAYRSGFRTELQDDINEALDRGHRNLTFRLRNWNGGPDDQNLELAFVRSACGRAAGDTSACTGLPAPTTLDWARDDNVFFPETEGLVGGDVETPRIIDTTAYMSDGVLVARLPDGTDFFLTGVNGTVAIRLTDALIVARLAADRSGLATGFIAGKWPRANAEASATTFGLCPGTPGYDAVSTTIGNALDVVANGEGGAGVPCDGISLAIGFEAQLARWGAPVADPLPPGPCP